jgi:hypothetical protein
MDDLRWAVLRDPRRNHPLVIGIGACLRGKATGCGDSRWRQSWRDQGSPPPMMTGFSPPGGTVRTDAMLSARAVSSSGQPSRVTVREAG